MLALNGIPLFYMELAIGQYLSLGDRRSMDSYLPNVQG